MAMTMSERLHRGLDTLISVGKLLVTSVRPRVSLKPMHEPLRPMLILGNGPSLTATLEKDEGLVERCDTMAVNFAATTPLFFSLRPRFYILMDPVFFTSDSENVNELWRNIAKGCRDWGMKVIVPRGRRARCSDENVLTFNAVGIEGSDRLLRFAMRRGFGMPRPRNVLIPSIACAMRMGYRRIYIAGADHSWTRTLSVDNNNTVVSIQPHFYSENSSEQQRVAAVYSDIRLHSILKSFAVAFRAYHRLQDYAHRHGVSIINLTPDSFIDAFPRGEDGS